MAYTIFGPFSNGGAPGISASFLNPLETFVASINSAATDANVTADGSGMETLLGMKLNTAAGTLTGSTNGSITWFQPFQGSAFKLFLMRQTGFRNNGGSAQTIVLPTAFTNRSHVWFWDTPSVGIQFKLSGTAQNVSVLTALSSSGGSHSIVTSILGPGEGEILFGWDTLSIPTGGSGTTDGVVLVVGF